MTKFQKQMLTIAAAGALTAVTALPAMAFENEFHGIFNFNAIFQNYSQSSTAGITIGESAAVTSSRSDQILEQRVRLQYIAKASDDLKLVTHFEINNAYGAKTTAPVVAPSDGSSPDFAGSDLDTDGVNLMTKHAYLDFNITKDINAKVGLQAYKDAIGGILIDADVPGVYINTKVSGVNLGFGMARYDDYKLQTAALGVAKQTGEDTEDLYSVDASYNLNKDTRIGASVYYNNDSTEVAKIEVTTLALNGQTKIGDVTVKGFAAMQQGKNAHVDAKGQAYNIVAATKVAGGNLKVGYLYTSGDDTGTDNKGWVGSGVASYNDSGMMFLIRNTGHNSTSTGSFYKLFDMSNASLVHVNYDKMLTDKLGAVLTVGARWNNEEINQTDEQKGFVGTEVNGEVNYKLYPNMTVLAQAGYVSLAEKYTGVNPYSVRAGIRFSF